MAGPFPTIATVVLDTTDARRLAEFYQQLFGLRYREGDEPPGDAAADTADWLVLCNPDGIRLAFQQVDVLPASTWPGADVPQQLHLDTTVPDAAALDEQTARAVGLGARVLFDRSDDPDEPLRVFADPAGHPFCIFVA